MTIYGTALLAVCLLAGQIVGTLLGKVIGVDANVGGVGIAMLMLIGVTSSLQRRGRLVPATQDGILFWSSVYIPVVVAMAACQNVRGAIAGGAVAIVAGVVAVAAACAMVPVILRLTPAVRAPADGRAHGEA
jgi:malonate transporter MadL subunit